MDLNPIIFLLISIGCTKTIVLRSLGWFVPLLIVIDLYTLLRLVVRGPKVRQIGMTPGELTGFFSLLMVVWSFCLFFRFRSNEGDLLRDIPDFMGPLCLGMMTVFIVAKGAKVLRTLLRQTLPYWVLLYFAEVIIQRIFRVS